MDDEEKFLEAREDVLNNIGILQINLEKCLEVGMEDPGDGLYNSIDNLINHVKNVSSWDMLKEAIEQAKKIEMEIDRFLLMIGQSTVGLTWPK